MGGDEREEIERLLGGAPEIWSATASPTIGALDSAGGAADAAADAPSSGADGEAHLREMEAFRSAELWDGGFVDADPLAPVCWSSYSTTGFVSVYYASYLACIKPYLRKGDRVMEIGPGRGVWTRALLRAGASRVYALDVQSRETNCIDQVLGADVDKLEYIVVSDFEGEGVPDGGIDFFWSFGTFVHLSHGAQAAYLRTIKRKLKPGGYGFIQFADFEAWNRVVADRSLHIHHVLADRMGGPEGETVRELMSASPIIAAREQIPEDILEDQRVHPGRYFYVGVDWLANEISAAGFQVIDRNVIENMRDPIIQFCNGSPSQE